MPSVPAFPALPTAIPAAVSAVARAASPVLDRLRVPPWVGPLRLSSEIAFFGYTQSGYDSDTENQEDIFAVSPLTGRVRRIVDDRGLPYKSDRDPAWSPGRRTLAIHSASQVDPESRLRVIRAGDGGVVQELVRGYSPEWLDAGTLLYLDTTTVHGRPDGPDVYSVDLSTSTVRRITKLGRHAEVTGMSWHRTAGLAVGYAVHGTTDDSAVAVVPAASVAAARAPGGSPVGLGALTALTPGTQVAQPYWAPGGDRITLVTWAPGSPSRVGYLDVTTGGLTLVPGPRPVGGAPVLSDSSPAFSPDGRSIAFCRGNEDEWSEIWLFALTTRRLRRLTDDHQGRFKAGLDW